MGKKAASTQPMAKIQRSLMEDLDRSQAEAARRADAKHAKRMLALQRKANAKNLARTRSAERSIAYEHPIEEVATSPGEEIAPASSSSVVAEEPQAESTQASE